MPGKLGGTSQICPSPSLTLYELRFKLDLKQPVYIDLFLHKSGVLAHLAYRKHVRSVFNNSRDRGFCHGQWMASDNVELSSGMESTTVLKFEKVKFSYGQNQPVNTKREFTGGA